MATTVTSLPGSAARANQTSNNFLQHDAYSTWGQELKNYQHNKTNYQGFAEPYVKRTHKDIKT